MPMKRDYDEVGADSCKDLNESVSAAWQAWLKNTGDHAFSIDRT